MDVSQISIISQGTANHCVDKGLDSHGRTYWRLSFKGGVLAQRALSFRVRQFLG